MDRQALLALWKLEDMPACEEGMMLAQIILESCGEGVNKLGTESFRPHLRYERLLYDDGGTRHRLRQL